MMASLPVLNRLQQIWTRSSDTHQTDMHVPYSSGYHIPTFDEELNRLKEGEKRGVVVGREPEQPILHNPEVGL